MSDQASTFRHGLILAVSSAAAFGLSGPFAKSLMATGWSPTAVVTARLAGGAATMAVVACIVAPGWIGEARRNARTVVIYGIVPIAGAQFCYFNAVAHLSVAVALLLEYLSPILVIAWIWSRTQRRPQARVLAGAALTLLGMTLVLNIFSGVHVDPIGVAWGLGASVCAACYFVLSQQAGGKSQGLQPITLTAGGLVVGTAAVSALAATGAMPLTFSSQHASVAGFSTPFYIPVIVLAAVTAALAYLLGIAAIARLKPSYASLVGLTEVLCAVIAAWALLGETIAPVQCLGAAVIIAGLLLAHPGNGGEHRPAGTTKELRERTKSYGKHSELPVISLHDEAIESTPCR